MTYSRGVRGAISVDNNTEADIKSATIELVGALIAENDINTEDISHVIFTSTNDINAQFPAKFVREHFNWALIPMMCYNELNVPNSIPKCLRALIVINTYKTQEEIKHVYLKSAAKLRTDLQK